MDDITKARIDRRQARIRNGMANLGVKSSGRIMAAQAEWWIQNGKTDQLRAILKRYYARANRIREKAAAEMAILQATLDALPLTTPTQKGKPDL